MKNASKRASGTAKELHGKVKRAVGKMVGSKRLQAEGRARELAGRDEKETAKAMERVKGAVEEVTGRIQGAAGDLIDDRETHVRGRFRQAKGKARQAANR